MIKRLLMFATVLCVASWSYASGTVVTIEPGDVLLVHGVDPGNNTIATNELSSYISPGTTTTISRECTKEDYKKALKTAKKYLPVDQTEALTSVTCLNTGTFCGFHEKQSDVLRRQADELDRKDKDLKYIQDVLNGNCE